MSETGQGHTYKQGHSSFSTATHERRTAGSDAAFLVPYIKPTDHILDVGCGPGTITSGFAGFATQGSVVGVDISTEVLQKAQSLADQANASSTGPGSVTFKHGNVLDRLPFDDGTFDIVFASQVLGHIPLPDLPIKALSEMRRILKPGGILATRDAADSHAYPRSLDLDRLFFEKQMLVLQNRKPTDDNVVTLMPKLFRKAGFDIDSGKVRVGGSPTVLYRAEDRQWMARRIVGMLQEGATYRQNWLSAGLTVENVTEASQAVQLWGQTRDAWQMSMQCEMLAWK